jgi:hypothetical protein
LNDAENDIGTTISKKFRSMLSQTKNLRNYPLKDLKMNVGAYLDDFVDKAQGVL